MMNLWDKYQEFPSDFLTQHHDLVLYDVFHQIKVLMLYPLNCDCGEDCTCEATRAKIILSLNVYLYNKALERQEDANYLYAMRYFFKIPDDAYFRKHYGEAYPLWLIQKEWQEKRTAFSIVARLIETLLRLGETYKTSYLRESRGSVKEAVEMILGKTPLKTKTNIRDRDEYLCGEKGYSSHLNTYKSICHFIAAFQFVGDHNSHFSLDGSQEIQEFLSIAHWIRGKLLALRTPNIKEKSLFSEDSLLALSSWVQGDSVNVPLELFEDKLQELKAEVEKAMAENPLDSWRLAHLSS